MELLEIGSPPSSRTTDNEGESTDREQGVEGAAGLLLSCINVQQRGIFSDTHNLLDLH